MCPDCEARRKLARDAFLNAKMSEAAGHIAKGAAEAVGLKKKTGVVESRTTRKRTTKSKETKTAN